MAYTQINDLDFINDFPTVYNGNLAITQNQYDTINKYLTMQSIASSSGSASINWDNGYNAKITLTENTTLTFVAPSNPCFLNLKITQDSTGGYTLTLPTIKWQGGVSPTFSTSANNISVISLFYDGSDYFGIAMDSFS